MVRGEPDYLAQTAYEAYGEQRGWSNHQGHPMPGWSALPDGVRNGWRAVADAIERELLLPVPLACPRCSHSALFHGEPGGHAGPCSFCACDTSMVAVELTKVA